MTADGSTSFAATQQPAGAGWAFATPALDPAGTVVLPDGSVSFAGRVADGRTVVASVNPDQASSSAVLAAGSLVASPASGTRWFARFSPPGRVVVYAVGVGADVGVGVGACFAAESPEGLLPPGVVDVAGVAAVTTNPQAFAASADALYLAAGLGGGNPRLYRLPADGTQPSSQPLPAGATGVVGVADVVYVVAPSSTPPASAPAGAPSPPGGLELAAFDAATLTPLGGVPLAALGGGVAPRLWLLPPPPPPVAAPTLVAAAPAELVVAGDPGERYPLPAAPVGVKVAPDGVAYVLTASPPGGGGSSVVAVRPSGSAGGATAEAVTEVAGGGVLAGVSAEGAALFSSTATGALLRGGEVVRPGQRGLLAATAGWLVYRVPSPAGDVVAGFAAG
jgi:hypothetical protein